MQKSFFFLLISLLLFQMANTAGSCTVCGKCTNCGPDVMADGYLNDIDALMQTKVQSLGYPIAINRNASASAIVYTIQYSSGLLISLQLSLNNMQIQLLSYSINSNTEVSTSTTTTTQTSSSSVVYKTTADGYYIMQSWGNSTQVNEILTYLGSVLKNNLTNFQLQGVQFTNSSQILYRLSFKVLPVSSGLTSVVQNVLVQYIGTNNYLLIDSNYSSTGTLNWSSLDTRAILNDPFISAINTLLLNKYNNLLGNTPTIVSLAQAVPYYQLSYQVNAANYSFIVLYDYFQNRILQGNLTTYKTTTTYQTQPQATSYTQITTTTQTSQGAVSSQVSGGSSSSTLQVSAYTPSTGAQTFYNGNAAVTSPTVTVTTTTTGAPTVYTVTNSPTTTSTAQGQTTASSSSSSSASTTSGTASSSSSTSAQATGYQQIGKFQSSAEVISILGYLANIGQNISMGQVQSVQKMQNGTVTQYVITVQLNNLGSVTVSRSIFYQYVIQLTLSGSYSVQQASYLNLNSPNFVILSLEEVKKDENIKLIARYLLSQQFPMLSSSSQVLAVYRDAPYYQLIFQGVSNTQLTFIILYGLNGSVQVLSATSKQVTPPQQNYTQTISNGQTSTSVQSNQTSQNTQTTQGTQSQTYQTATQTQTVKGSQTTSQQGQSGSSQQSSTVQPVLQQNTQTQNQTSNQGSSSTQVTQQTEPTFVQIKQAQSNTSSQSQTAISSQSTSTVQAGTATTSNTAYTPTTTTVQTPSATSSSATSSNGASSTSSSSSTATSSATTGQSTSTTTSTSLGGYNRFGSSQDQFYSYAIQGINQINQTLEAKGYNISQLIYKDIVYKLQSNVLTILYKVQVDGLLFTYQYKGNIGSSYTLTSPEAPSAIQTSSDSQSYTPDANTIVSGGVTYQLASSSFTSQTYIQSYLNFLATNDASYSRSNLVGIYVNPKNPNTVFFRFKNTTQYYNIVTNTVEIQRILSIYLSDSASSTTTTTTTTSTFPASSSSSNTQTSASNQQGSTQSTSSSFQQGSSTQQTNQSSTQTQVIQNTQASTTQQSQTSIFQNTQQTSQNSSSTGSQTSQNTQQTIQTAPIKSSQVITSINVDAHCLCYDQSKCLKCAHRYYLNNNRCIQVPNECLSYDINSGVCVKCLPGYSIANGLCQLDDVTAYYYEGQCFQCLGDYRLVNRRCVYAPVSDPKSPQYLQTKNPLCLGWNNGVCDECLPGTYLSSRQICELVDPFCLIFDYTKETCNTCRDGYTLRSGKCFNQ